jgi:hypothetical protein
VIRGGTLLDNCYPKKILGLLKGLRCPLVFQYLERIIRGFLPNDWYWKEIPGDGLNVWLLSGIPGYLLNDGHPKGILEYHLNIWHLSGIPGYLLND